MSITNEGKVWLSKWVDGRLVFFTQNDDDTGEVHFGINTNGMDVKFHGDTAKVYMKWDAGAGQWNLVGATLVSDSAITGITPTTDYHLSTKKYVDDQTAADIIYDGTETLEAILDDTINAGVLDAITVDNDRGGLTIDWTAGEIFDHATKTVVDTVSGTDSATDNSVNYLIWTTGTSLSLGVIQADVSNDEIPIASIAAQDGMIHNVHTDHIISERETGISDAMGSILDVVVTNGLVVSEHLDATNALDVECSAGVFYQEGHEKHVVSKITSSGTLLMRDFKTGGVWDSDLDAEIDTAFYNNGTDLAAASNKWYKSFFIVAKDHLHWVYPTVQYDNRIQAIVAPLPTKPPGLAGFPNSVALVYQGGDAALPTAGGDQWIDIRPVVGATTGAGAITDHGNLTGLTNDDHSLYPLVDNSRGFTGGWSGSIPTVSGEITVVKGVITNYA